MKARGSNFATTSWSMVLDAAGSSGSQTTSALANLCQTYWYPLYAFIRRKGYSSSDAEDLTQSFFVELLDRDRLAVTDRGRGRFRTFLLACLDNFLKNQRRHAEAAKRGGGRQILSLDFEAAENQYHGMEPFHEWTPERVFDRTWAMAVLKQVLESLQQQYTDSGKGQLFDALRDHIAGGSSPAYQKVAEELGMKEGAVKVAVHRLRERYGQQLRLQVARTLDEPEQVNEELRYLFEALASEH